MKYLSIIGTGDEPWIYLCLQVAVFLHLLSLTREKLTKKCQWPLLRSRTACCLIFLASSDMEKTSLNPCGERATPLTDLIERRKNISWSLGTKIKPKKGEMSSAQWSSWALDFIWQRHTPQEVSGLSRVTTCTCELRNKNFLSQHSPECNTSRDVWNPSVTCTLSCTGTPRKDSHMTLVLQTLKHVLEDILKASGAGHAVNNTEHKWPVQMSTAAGTLQFQQLHRSSVGTVSLEWPSMNVCFFLVPWAWLPGIFLSFIRLTVCVALGLIQVLMLHCREDAALGNSFIT